MKILPLDELAPKAAQLRAAGKTLVLAHGCFDICHPGHVNHLKKARAFGDILAVSITADRHVHKGPGRPAFNQQLRAEMLEALEVVDYVVVVDDPTALPVIEALRPDVYCKGFEYAHRRSDPGLSRECALVESHGGRVEFAGATLGSSTSLFNEYFSTLSAPVQGFLRDIKAKYPLARVYDWLEAARSLKVLVIGDNISDRYIYVAPVGQSIKEPTITYALTGHSKEWNGGAWVVAENARAVCDNVSCLTTPIAIEKIRYVWPERRQRVFYAVTPTELPALPIASIDWGKYDAIIAADFGHGAITREEAKLISAWAPWLALMVQTNSLNHGFNRYDKYAKCNYLVMNELELRLSSSALPSCPQKVVTRGERGSLVDKCSVPAISGEVVDRMGSGDAYLACSAPLACLEAPPELIGLVGTVAAGLAVGKEGNEPVTRLELMRTLEALLK